MNRLLDQMKGIMILVLILIFCFYKKYSSTKILILKLENQYKSTEFTKIRNKIFQKFFASFLSTKECY